MTLVNTYVFKAKESFVVDGLEAKVETGDLLLVEFSPLFDTQPAKQLLEESDPQSVVDVKLANGSRSFLYIREINRYLEQITPDYIGYMVGDEWDS